MKDWTYCDGDGGLEAKAQIPRRMFLAAGVAGLTLMLGRKTALAQASFQGQADHENVVVVIFLRGGCDGLNTVAPFGEDDYHKARPTLTLGKGVIDLDGFYGFHPSLKGLEPLFKEGKLAAVQAVGSFDQSRSHFEAMSAMERGTAQATDAEQSGWLGRHILATPGRVSPLRALALSAIMPDSLAGAPGALAMESLAEYQLKANDETLAQLAALYAEGNDQVSEAGRGTIQVLKALRQTDPKGYKPENIAVYPENGLGRALSETAFLIRQDLGLEVACLDMGGWDTHVAQGGGIGWHATLLQEVGDSVAAFFRDLGAESKRVTLIVQSEFGRRIEENSGFGTDHGSGGVLLAVGGGVQGGKVYGDWPTLAKSKQTGPGDLLVTTDYRQVLAEVIQHRLGNRRLDRVFPGLKPKPFGMITA